MIIPPAISLPINQAVEQAAEHTLPVPIGFIVLAIILAPVIAFSMAAVFSHPRQYRVPGLFIASVVLLIGLMVAGFAAIGIVLKFIVPN